MSNHLNTILSFLSESFENGRAYSTIINGYRSMFSSTLDKVAGVSIGQHPWLPALWRVYLILPPPPQSRYESTWDVDVA